jgi:hypothetical protein
VRHTGRRESLGDLAAGVVDEDGDVVVVAPSTTISPYV